MITLATLNQATPQQVFDQAKNHLLSQKKQSVNKRNECAYRGENGLKCAAGCFISDQEYNDSFEGKTWIRLVIRNSLSKNHASLIEDLQSVHDCSNPDKWEEELKKLAKTYKLDWTN